MINSSIISQYLDHGKNLIPLNVNIPYKDWRTTIYPKEYIISYNDNIGWSLSNTDLVIDVDPRNDGDKSFEQLIKDLNIKLNPDVVTPRGGFHIYLKIPEKYKDFSFKKTLKKYKGIDFLHEGCYCLIPGCSRLNGQYKWYNDSLSEFKQEEASEELLQLLSYKNNDSNEDLGDFEGLIGGNSSNWTEEKVLQMISRLDPSMPNDEWVKVGMALHDWDTIEGLEIWEEWSKAGENYDEGETEKRWESFKLGQGVTLGTISYMVKEVNFDENFIKVNEYIERIKYADEKILQFELIPKIKKENLNNIDKEKIVKSIQNRFKEITDVKLPINNVREMVNEVNIISGHFVEEGKKPEWCKKWVYINSHSCFANLESLRLYKTESFNIKNGKYVPENQTGAKQSASRYVSDKGFMETVDIMAYLPSINESICNIDDLKILNSFNPKTVPVASTKYTEEGKNAIRLIKKHIKFICSNEEYSNIFTQWLAHNIQFPGKQILWSPIIQSIQGVGKSFFGELLRSTLGDRNVGTVSPSQVISDFNGWATNVMVNVLEELRVKGKNRYEAINSLKPLITDRMIQINDKGIRQYMTYNTTNYICFTNYKDSLPLDSDDRRWWVIFVPVESLEEMEEIIGEKITDYFPKLFDAVRNNGSEVRKWLLEYKLTKEFLSIKQAPMTNDKLSMIATEESSLEGFQEVKELISETGEFFNKYAISSSDLFENLMFKYPELDIQGPRRNIILKKLGYSQTPKPLKIKGKTRRIWTKKTLPNKKIRELLEDNL